MLGVCNQVLSRCSVMWSLINFSNTLPMTEVRLGWWVYSFLLLIWIPSWNLVLCVLWLLSSSQLEKKSDLLNNDAKWYAQFICKSLQHWWGYKCISSGPAAFVGSSSWSFSFTSSTGILISLSISSSGPVNIGSGAGISSFSPVKTDAKKLFQRICCVLSSGIVSPCLSLKVPQHPWSSVLILLIGVEAPWIFFWCSGLICA